MCFLAKNGLGNSGADTQFDGGDGTADNPYQISTAIQLNAIRNNLSAYYILTNNIDCAGLTKWVPIGTIEEPFSGSLKGNGFIISNIKISEITIDFKQFAGLFAVTQGITLKDINIQDAKITLNGDPDMSSHFEVYTGCLVAYNMDGDVNILNCHVNATVGCNTTSRGSFYFPSTAIVGGLIGALYDTVYEAGNNIEYTLSISNSSFTGDVQLYCRAAYGLRGYVGGMVGFCGYTLKANGLEYIGNVSSSTDYFSNRSFVGCIVAHCNTMYLDNVTVKGDITAKAREVAEEDSPEGGTSCTVAGIAGRCGDYELHSISVESNITGYGDYGGYSCVGGLLAEAENGTIDNCQYNGDIVARATTICSKIYVDGLIGSSGATNILKSTSVCTIHNRGYHHSDVYTGGLIGYPLSASIENSNSTCQIEVTAYDNACPYVYSGGLVGYIDYGVNCTLKIKECTSAGIITTDEAADADPNFIGGIVGYFGRMFDEPLNERFIYDSSTIFNTSYPICGVGEAGNIFNNRF